MRKRGLDLLKVWKFLITDPLCNIDSGEYTPNLKQSFNGFHRHEFKDVVGPLQYHGERELDQRARDVEALIDLGAVHK